MNSRATYIGLLCRGIDDLFGMLQSQTFMSQIAYGLLEILVVSLFPELRDLFGLLHSGPSSAADNSVPGRPEATIIEISA